VRIALHCGTLRGFGSGLVGRNVLKHLAEQGPKHHFLTWVPEEWAADHDVTADTVPSNVELRFTRSGLRQKMVLENWHIRRALVAWKADVLFSAGDTSLVACPIPHLLLIHQPNLAYGPGERAFPMSPAQRLRWRVMSAYLRLGLGSVTAVTVQTQDMATRISARFAFPRERISVTPSAIQRVALGSAPPNGLGDAPPFVTYVASASAHKNFAVLAPMMAHLRDRCPGLQCRLTVAPEQVPELSRAIEQLQVADLFVFEGRVSQDYAIELLRKARCLVMPSKLESFGLPYYEAMAEGTPVVAADLPFAREACGVAAAYADADSGEAFAEAVAALTEDEELWRTRSAAAQARFQGVARTWDSITAEYLQLLEALGQRAQRDG
jgi:glycosyltransferase involved in cell wall biosynthesis